MSEKKYKFNLNKYCLLIVSLIIFSGCASQTKREKILSIQKIRIKKLEKQLAIKQKTINHLKTQKWVSQPTPKPVSLALSPLKNHIKNKRWVAALRLSNKLKGEYPSSIRLTKLRVAIFKKMGLKKQAMEEMIFLQKLKAKSLRKGKVRRI